LVEGADWLESGATINEVLLWCVVWITPTTAGGVTRRTYTCHKRFCATTDFRIRGSEGVVQNRHHSIKGDSMSLNIRQLMDKITDGSISSDDINDIGIQINDGEELDETTIKELYEDLSVVRYNYTMEVLLKTAVEYFIRPKASNARALRDYKRGLNILKFIIKETEELHEAEQEDENY
jgi:hypothetical protein